MTESTATTRLCTGVPGLDDVLGGGFPARRLYLIQGEPGAGKTTLSMQFLMEGARAGEPVLYVSLSETREEIAAIARAHGWDLSQVHIYDMAGREDEPLDQENTLYVPDEVELNERMHELLAKLAELKPKRVVLDSCSELRLLARTPLRFRRQLLALKNELLKHDTTVLLLESAVERGGDVLLQSLVHGVVQMEQLAPLYGAERRRLRTHKLREVAFRGGYHDYVLRRGGLTVFPRLVAAEHHVTFSTEALSSGVSSLDGLVGGGLPRGTCTLVMGPAGCGKSAVCSLYVAAAAKRGENAAVFTFDESDAITRRRAAGIGLSLEAYIASGHVTLQQIDPAELSPGEMVHAVREAVEKRNAKVVVLDSLSGYIHALPEESFVLLQLHELLSYLRQHGVVTLLVMGQHGVVGHSMTSPVDVSYLADAILLLRYFEAGGRVRKAISVLKMRTCAHENTIRELNISREGIELGPPLDDFRGVLTGVPAAVGTTHEASGNP